MSTKSMKSLMVKNQKENRMKLEKVINNMGFKKVSEGNSHLQDEVAAYTANTLREPIDQALFFKTKKEQLAVTSAKITYKATKHTKASQELRNEMLSIITKGKTPNWNIVLKVA